jgi:hypothetical protein
MLGLSNKTAMDLCGVITIGLASKMVKMNHFRNFIFSIFGL